MRGRRRRKRGDEGMKFKLNKMKKNEMTSRKNRVLNTESE